MSTTKSVEEKTLLQQAHIGINKNQPKERKMLATDKIAKAFKAIVEEAEKLQRKDNSKKTEKSIKTIISIAKHQSDIRDAKKGSCCGKNAKKCGKH